MKAEIKKVKGKAGQDNTLWDALLVSWLLFLYADGPSFAMRVSGGIFSPPASLKAQSSQRKNIFSFLLTPEE
jgi:hypothetical protein